MKLLAFITLSTFFSAFVSSAQIKSWLTQADSNGNVISLLQPQTDISTSTNIVSGNGIEININSANKFQTIEGFGAGLPQSSSYVLSNLKKSNPNLYQYVLNQLFSKENGMGMNILRFPIGSCDFSIHNTSYDETYWDWNLGDFAIDPDSETIVSVLQDVYKVNPELTVIGKLSSFLPLLLLVFYLIASPWSAPSWLKTLQSLIAYNERNTLVDDDYFYLTYAKYFIKVLETYLARGININYLTLQNEPLFGTSDQYPGMYLTSENSARLFKKLSPLLIDFNKKYSKNVEVLAYDHNWDHPEYPADVISRTRGDGVEGEVKSVAWHCYGGDMKTALTYISSKYPEAKQHLTECTGAFPNDTCDITQGMTSFGWNHEWDMANLLVGATSYGACSSTKWILALDENCGPFLPDVTFNFGRPFVSIPSSASSESDIKWNQDFWSMAHMSKFIPKGSQRVQSVVNNDHSGSLLTETYLNSATHTLTTIVLNYNHQNELGITISDGVNSFITSVPPFGTKVYQWNI
jgi:glucosylceramidase